MFFYTAEMPFDQDPHFNLSSLAASADKKYVFDKNERKLKNCNKSHFFVSGFDEFGVMGKIDTPAFQRR